MKGINDNFRQEDLNTVIEALSIALVEKNISEVALGFAKALVEISNSPNILRLSAEMRQSAKFRTIIEQTSPNVMEEIGYAIAKIIEETYPNINFSIEGRVKTLFSEVNKRINKLLEAKNPQIQDLLALRIIVLTEEEEKANIDICYKIANVLLEHFSLFNPSVRTDLSWDISLKDVAHLKNSRALLKQKYPYRIIPDNSQINPIFKTQSKDFIYSPNGEGYQGIHLIICYKGIPLEIQIRTVLMHHWATSGPAKHASYKSKKFQGINLGMFEESQIGCAKYTFDCDGNLITFPGLVNPIQSFGYRSH